MFKRFVVSSLLSIAVQCILVSTESAAASLNVVNGQLRGASGVIVDGSSYNVEFLDGTCIALYDGCDDVSDFTFQTQADAVMASQALLDQVFLDGSGLFYDTVPGLTNGCTYTQYCEAWTPHEAAIFWSGSRARNAILDDLDFVDAIASVSHIGSHLSSFTGSTFARWTPVPEPGTAVLMGLGLLAMGVRGRREQS